MLFVVVTTELFFERFRFGSQGGDVKQLQVKI